MDSEDKKQLIALGIYAVILIGTIWAVAFAAVYGG